MKEQLESAIGLLRQTLAFGSSNRRFGHHVGVTGP
jgi:hypothetical protein